MREEVSIVIPNFNGRKYLEGCLKSLDRQKMKQFEVILVDNGSTDGSSQWALAQYPQIKIIQFSENTGFCKAVNEGIKAAETPYVLLLNNDMEVKENFVSEMLAAIKRHKKAFACQAKMVSFYDRSLIDDAGNYYCALGWAFARGKGRLENHYQKEEKIFACCGGASIYRKELFDRIGYFDEEHFAYLEDLDIGYRARIFGYQNWFVPRAVVYHIGSGTTGSRYNQFKTRYSSRNNVYMLYKNMPAGQIVLNLPLLVLGFGTEIMFFTVKGFGKEYLAGIKNGLCLCKRDRKVPRKSGRISVYCKIQLELWYNILRKLMNN